MAKKVERIVLTDDQLNTLKNLGVDLRGKELSVGLIAGRVPFIRPIAEAEEEIIICVTGC